MSAKSHQHLQYRSCSIRRPQDHTVGACGGCRVEEVITRPCSHALPSVGGAGAEACAAVLVMLHGSVAMAETAPVSSRTGRGRWPGAAVACGSGLQGARERRTEPTRKRPGVLFVLELKGF